jgi:hypothetical protein
MDNLYFASKIHKKIFDYADTIYIYTEKNYFQN